MVGKRHDDSYMNQILQKYYSQYTDEELFKLYNIDKDTIRRCRRKFNLKRCNRKINFDVAEKYGLNAADLSRDYVMNPLNIENKDLPEVEDVRIMFEDYKMNNADIAHFFSMDSHFIREITDNFTPNYIRPKKVIDYINEDPELPNKVKELRDAGFKNPEILKKLSIPGSCLTYIVRNYNLYKDDEAGDIHALDGYDIDFSKLSRDYIKNPLHMRVNGKVNREFPTREDFLYLFKEKNVRREDICKYFKISDGLINAILKEYNIEDKTSEEKRENYLREIRKNYGVDNVFQLESTKEKSKNTMEERYGEIYQKTDEYIQKVKATKLERYGDENYVGVEVLKKNSLKKYGTSIPSRRDWNDRTKYILENTNNFEEYLKESGLTNKYEIAKDLNVHYNIVNRFARDNNLQDLLDCYDTEGEVTIKNMFPGMFEKRRDLIGHMEIDLYNENNNFGIEYNGIYWHSDQYKTDNMYHQNKYLKCKNKNIKLYVIWENFWKSKDNSKDIIISDIKKNIGLSQIIQVKQHTIRKLNSNEISKFIAENCIRKHYEYDIGYGLFDDKNFLLSIILLKDNNIILYRDIKNFIVENSFDMLFNILKYSYNELYFKYDPSIFCNLNEILLKNGFEYIGITKPNIFYVNKNEYVDISPMNLDKFCTIHGIGYEQYIWKKK